MKEVSSSNLKAVDFNYEVNTLAIQFNSGALYWYYDVPPEVALGLMLAESHGEYFQENIRDHFDYERVI